MLMGVEVRDIAWIGELDVQNNGSSGNDGWSKQWSLTDMDPEESKGLGENEWDEVGSMANEEEKISVEMWCLDDDCQLPDY